MAKERFDPRVLPAGADFDALPEAWKKRVRERQERITAIDRQGQVFMQIGAYDEVVNDGSVADSEVRDKIYEAIEIIDRDVFSVVENARNTESKIQRPGILGALLFRKWMSGDSAGPEKKSA